MLFMSNKLIALITVVGALLLSSCSEDGEHKYKAEHFSQSQALKTPPDKQTTIQNKNPHSPHISEPTSDQYNANPPQARHPFPPIPDEQANPPKESQ